MTDIAIRVDNFTLSSVEGLSKLYPEPAARAGHLGALQQRHDTTSTVLSASLRDALTGFLPRIARITRMQKENSLNSPNSRQASQENSLNSPNSRQASGSDDLWALKDVSFETCPELDRRVRRGGVVGTPALAAGASVPSTRLRTSIGRNGAGKSTLVSTSLNTRLKILSRSRAYQRPRRDLRRPGRLPAGRFAGTGSLGDPELTGRENIRFASTARSWACGAPRPVLSLSKHRPPVRRDLC